MPGTSTGHCAFWVVCQPENPETETLRRENNNYYFIRMKHFLYYLSFVLIYSLLAFGTSIFLFDYDKDLSDWSTMGMLYQIAYIVFYILQIPFGVLISLITQKEPSVFFAISINPVIIAWLFYKIIGKGNLNFLNKTSKVNFSICAIFLLVYLGFFCLK